MAGRPSVELGPPQQMTKIQTTWYKKSTKSSIFIVGFMKVAQILLEGKISLTSLTGIVRKNHTQGESL